MEKKSERKLSRKQAAELQKRKLKGCSGLVTKGVDIDHDLYASVSDATRKQVAAILEDPDHPDEISSRDLMTAAIATHLPAIVAALRELGFGVRTGGKQRPRAFDDAAWQCLMRAEELVAVSAVSLARATLTLLAARGANSVNLQDCLRDMDRLGDQIAEGKPDRRARTKKE
jgi:hypothetical protein